LWGTNSVEVAATKASLQGAGGFVYRSHELMRYKKKHNSRIMDTVIWSEELFN
jgi:hypothetical protein